MGVEGTKASVQATRAVKIARNFILMFDSIIYIGGASCDIQYDWNELDIIDGWCDEEQGCVDWIPFLHPPSAQRSRLMADVYHTLTVGLTLEHPKMRLGYKTPHF